MNLPNITWLLKELIVPDSTKIEKSQSHTHTHTHNPIIGDWIFGLKFTRWILHYSWNNGSVVWKITSTCGFSKCRLQLAADIVRSNIIGLSIQCYVEHNVIQCSSNNISIQRQYTTVAIMRKRDLRFHQKSNRL